MRQAVGAEIVGVVAVAACRVLSEGAHLIAEHERAGPLVALLRHLLQIDPLYISKGHGLRVKVYWNISM